MQSATSLTSDELQPNQDYLLCNSKDEKLATSAITLFEQYGILDFSFCLLINNITVCLDAFAG